jgi:serine/threonine-protein kinase
MSDIPRTGHMHDRVTLMPPDAQAPDSRLRSSSLPGDLLQQVRGRLRLLAAFFLVAFALDPLLFVVAWVAATVAGNAVAPELSTNAWFRLVDAIAVVASVIVWFAARRPSTPTSRLYALGLAYEVAICLVIALTEVWQHYRSHGILPNLTWVPAVVILFPLVMPGPPRRMLGAAIVAAAMYPLSITLLDAVGAVESNPDAYLRAVVSSVFAVVFAYMGSRVVYGLGRELAVAREMGSYRLDTLIGQGGMGEVWRASHRMLARPAAIKLIRRSPNGTMRDEEAEAARRRFEREAQTIALLRSPHTVDLFDFGQTADGSFYYVMELLDGLDAEQLVTESGPLPPERVVYLVQQMCHSLSEAEAHGLVHRDIKPSNIFVCRYGEDYDFVKVLDFGIVKSLTHPVESDPALTRDGFGPLTPDYASPEQAMGLALDSRVDIYATGCVAYWLLTGERVFTGDNALSILTQHAHKAPTPPSSRVSTVIPTLLDRVVMSCLAKDPAQRPQSARELIGHLAEIPLATPWTQERARQWWETARIEDRGSRK